MSKTQVFTPAGGMNQDDSIITPTPDTAGRNAFGLGDYKYALNARIGSSKSDNFGDLENLKGTRRITAYFSIGGLPIPEGEEKVLGKYEDKENRRLYMAVWNSEGTHTIRYYDPAIDAVVEILRWSEMGFQQNSFIKMAMLDNWLCLTDRINGIRLMDVNTIGNLFLSLGADFREYHISFHKWSPVMPPIVKAYWDGVTNNYAKFENKTYQFSYRYIYKGNLKSTWSPISNSAEQFEGNSGNQITAIELYIPGFSLNIPGALVAYNYFDNNDPQFIKAADYIEIAYREGARDLWRILKRHTVDAISSNTVFRFDGGANSTPIPIDDFAQPFDTVPILSGTVETIDNRFMFADCLEEYEPADTPIITDIGVAKWGGNDSLGSWWNAGNNNQSDNSTFFPSMSPIQAQELGLRNMICDTTFKGRGIYKVGIQYFAASGWKSGVYTADNWIYEIEAETGIVDRLYALMFKIDASYSPPEWAVGYQIMRTNCLNIDYFMFGAVNAITPLIDNTTVLTDNLEVPESLRNRIQQHFENAKLVTGQDYGKYLETLANAPFFQSVSSDVRRTAIAGALSDASRLYIDVNNWYNSSRKNSLGTQNNPINKLFYNYRQGDRVRFIASATASPISSQKVVYDVPILEFTGRGIVIEKPIGIQWLPGMVGSESIDYMIEVYTPKIPNQADYIYYESGEWYPILYPGTVSRDFAKRDWTYTNNAAITCDTYVNLEVYHNRPFSYGDCHGVLKTHFFNLKTIPPGAISVSLYTASMNPDKNKTFDFWEKSDGRAAFAYTDFPVVMFKTTQVRFGGQIVEQSFVNQINRFKDEDQKIFPSEYGRIRMLVATENAQVESVGSILLAISERQTFSIYVNRTTLEDLAGNTQVALSNRILGSYNTLLGSHGTLNPESVCVERGRVYFWDAIDGTWVRYGRDGLTEISFYKMRNWFRELGVLLINEYGEDVKPTVISEFDPYNEELITFINHSSLPSTFRDYATYKGAVFSEEDTRWKSIHSYTPEMFAKLNNQLMSLKGGTVYIHEATSDYSTFYDTKYDVYIEPVFNEIPKDVKSWQNMAYVATHKWSVERFLSEYRGAKTKQQSSMTLAQFDEREDAYYGEIPMNINTPVVANPIINGDKMRSKAIRALMKLDPSVVILSLLHYVEAGEINSPKNP